MAWRIHDLVIEGELDNTVRGLVKGWLRLTGYDEPVQLRLLGNCHPDIAGWRLKIQRTEPVPPWSKDDSNADLSGLAEIQEGHAGDITASQTLKAFHCSISEFLAKHREGDPPPTELRKALYLEWYSSRNDRVVIQDWRLGIEFIGEQAFRLTEEEYRQEAEARAPDTDLDSVEIIQEGNVTIMQDTRELSQEERAEELMQQERDVKDQIRRLEGNDDNA